MVTFVTTNPGKTKEAASYLGESVEQHAFDYPEPQTDSFADVAAHGARVAHDHVGGPVIVDDAGLSIAALDGFPGPFSSYVEETLGIERVSRLARQEPGTNAAFHTVVGYCDGDPIEGDDVTVDEGTPPVALFEGVVDGRIVPPRGKGGFGYDPIFEHDGQTFAEMTTTEKNAVSHRGRALAVFADWYADRTRE
jgi:non-canonical purine NTP pyrophosphatase, rdgB/HAM1 family